MTRHELVVADRDAGQRLDTWIAAAGIELSRSQARHLIDAGAIRVGSAVRKPGYAVRAGDRIEVEVPPPPAPRAEPEDLPLQVLYEDALLVVINKAPGMVVHPAPGRWQGTLVNALLHRWGRLPTGDDVRPGIVHRLDRETSGVMVIARTPAALEHLARQFHDRTVTKRYLAVVRGVMRRDELVIDAAIGRHPTERKKMSTRARRGRVAVTRVRVLERFSAATLVEASPQTGRTHQIRVHLAAQGFPILGDAVYGGGASATRGAGRRAGAPLPTIARQALHAASLEVTHPERGERLRFDAPLWLDMEQLLGTLRTAT
jgi:23S rRNA pseudouridine1911/1915/1917 synthase